MKAYLTIVLLFVAICSAVSDGQDAQTAPGFRVLKSSDRVKIGGRSYRIKRPSRSGSVLASHRNGSCVFDGQLFRHGGNVSRPDPCDKCMCFSGEVLCWKTQCPPLKSAKGCREVNRPGVCCPVLECEVTAPVKSSKNSFKPPKKTRPFVPIASKSKLSDIQTECEVEGRLYKFGQLVTAASGPCMECRCGIEGQIKCKPRKCHYTGSLDLAKVARVSHNTDESYFKKEPVMIIQNKDAYRKLV